MVDVDKIIKAIEDFAPLSLAEEWDNSGWQIDLFKKEVDNILVCLTVTPKILEQAIEQNCGLIIAHHPMFIRDFIYSSVTKKLIIDCVKSGIQVYSAHTNLDCTEGGVTDTLCEKLGFEPAEIVEKFVRIGEFAHPISLDDFILKLKISLNASKIKLTNPHNVQEIKRVAVCSGSGGEFVNSLTGVDAFVTGDIKYHVALDVDNMVLIDAGHFETERIILQTLKNILTPIAPNLIIAKETEPWKVV